jgi:hypothetical protein
MTGQIDGALDEIDSNLRDLRRELSTLEAFRRQLVGDDKPLIGGVDGGRERRSGSVS